MLLLLLNNSLIQILMASSRGKLVNKESTSKDAINKPASCSQIILADSKESFNVNSLEVS